MTRTILFSFLLPLAVLVSSCSEPVEIQAPESISAAEEIYKKNCKVCHAQGINGAPIIGNNKMWGKRVVQGRETLISHASQGYGLMPAKGGNENISDMDIGQVVDFMLAALENKP
jgi:cytochrome c5